MTKENLIYRLNLHVEDEDIYSFSVNKEYSLVQSEDEIHLIMFDDDLKEQYYNIFKDQR